MIYLDTSILVAALTNESRTGEMQAWLADRPAGELCISDWVVTEFSAALSLKLRMLHIEKSHRADALAVFNKLIDQALHVLPVSRQHYHSAARLADQYSTGLRSGDALHLAIASSHSANLHALDKGLVKAAQKLGVSAKLL